VAVDADPGHAECFGDGGRTLTTGAAGVGGANVSAPITMGHLPARPWARAAASPAMVRSSRMSHATLANVAIIVKKKMLSPTGLRAGRREARSWSELWVLSLYVRPVARRGGAPCPDRFVGRSTSWVPCHGETVPPVDNAGETARP